MTNTTEEQKKEDIKTFTLWTFKQYKENIKSNHNYNIQRVKENKERIKRAIKELKQELKEIKNPIKKIPTQDGYKESLIRQRLTAQEINCFIIENKDSEVLKWQINQFQTLTLKGYSQRI